MFHTKRWMRLVGRIFGVDAIVKPLLHICIHQSFDQKPLQNQPGVVEREQNNANTFQQKKDLSRSWDLGCCGERDEKRVNEDQIVPCDCKEVRTFAKCQAFTFEKW